MMVVVAQTGLPFFLNILAGNFTGLILMSISFLYFLAFLPMMVCWVSIYSYSRFWDLTWGNVSCEI